MILDRRWSAGQDCCRKAVSIRQLFRVSDKLLQAFANDIATVANCIFIDRLPDHPLSERQPAASKLVPMGAFFATRRLVMIEPSHGGQAHGHLQQDQGQDFWS